MESPSENRSAWSIKLSKSAVLTLLRVRGRRVRNRNPHPCYTGATLSDLDVSGGLPFNQASLPCTDFPKPLQRNHISLPPGDLCHGLYSGPASLKRISLFKTERCSRPGASVVPAGNVPPAMK